MTIAERNRLIWPDLVNEPDQSELILQWAKNGLNFSDVGYVPFPGNRKMGVWETDPKDNLFAPAKESYVGLMEEIRRY